MKVPKKGPRFTEVIAAAMDSTFFERMTQPDLRALTERANEEGWNWEQCKYHAIDAKMPLTDLWAAVKLSRAVDRKAIPLRDNAGKSFTYRLSSSSQRVLHLIDKNLGGSIQSAWPQLDTPTERNRYLINSLYEEAIASSQIEGAAVTREVAKEMLMTGRKPRNRDERMILNNYRTIQFLNQRRREPLTVALLLEIQSHLTEGAIDKEDARGRFRTSDESVVVWDEEDHEPLHVPPLAHELAERMEALCRFANADSSSQGKADFVHPALRAIFLHFWLAYDHPFVDGNGRTARALFYWSMLRSDYWLVEYLTISAIIRQQTKQYARAFLNTEIDENDLTYFMIYHLELIERSIQAFRDYLDKKITDRNQLAQVVRPAIFNDRQQAILLKALKDPETRFTYESHAQGQGVTIATARSDLLSLEQQGLLVGNRAGRRFEFVAIPELENRLKRLSKRTPK